MLTGAEAQRSCGTNAKAGVGWCRASWRRWAVVHAVVVPVGRGACLCAGSHGHLVTPPRLHDHITFAVAIRRRSRAKGQQPARVSAVLATRCAADLAVSARRCVCLLASPRCVSCLVVLFVAGMSSDGGYDVVACVRARATTPCMHCLIGWLREPTTPSTPSCQCQIVLPGLKLTRAIFRPHTRLPCHPHMCVHSPLT